LKLRTFGIDSWAFFSLAQPDNMGAVDEAFRAIDLNVEEITE
jgi:hypothetical protein